MSAELEAAIQLCGQVHADGNRLTEAYRKGSFNYSVAVLADAYLADLDAKAKQTVDDAFPIDESFVRSLGFKNT